VGLTQRRQGAKADSAPVPVLRALAPWREILLALIVVAYGANASRGVEEPPPAAKRQDESAGYRVETILAGLDHPTSVIVRPGSEGLGTAELFVAESGAGRVLRIVIDDPVKSEPVITGFPVAEIAALPGLRGGPLGLAFLSRNRLAVGGGGLGDGEDVVRVYSVSDAATTLEYDQTDHTAGPVPASESSETGEGDFFSLAASDRVFLVAPLSGDDAGWLLKATLDANRIAGLEPFIATREASDAAGPTAVAVDPQPQRHYVVVAQRGEPTAERDSRLTMYSSTSGAMALNLNTGLRDVFALGYSPSPSFDLYSADYSQAEPADGGIYRIEAAQVDGRESCRAVKIAAIARPTSLAFTGDGAMYVTAFGEASDESESDAKPNGVLLKITPQSDTPRL
jgi:hypothetical protein